MAKNVQRAEQILKKSVQRAEQMEHKKGEHHVAFTLVMFAFGAFIPSFNGLWWSLLCQETSFVLKVLFHNNLTLCCSAHCDEDTVGGSLNLACG